jgi:hypothetical protein
VREGARDGLKGFFSAALLGSGNVNSPHVLDGMRRILFENETR